MSIAAEEQRRVFHTLDLLRGVAALAVAGHHLGGILDRWLPASALAVDLFFILSGLVVSHAYESRLASGTLGTGAFLKLRLIRLYPLYILGTLGMLSLFLLKGYLGHGDNFSLPLLFASLAFAALFLPTPSAASVSPGTVYPLNNPAWSLFWELIVNVLYAGFIRSLKGPALAAMIGTGALLLAYGSFHYGGLNIGGLFPTFFGGMDRVIFGFFCGVGLEHARRKNLLPRIFLPAWLSVIILIAAFALRPAAFPALYDAVVVLVVFPLLVACSLGHPPRWMETISSKLGLASYAIYALQTPLLAHFAFVEHGLAFELAFLVALTAIALASDYLYDQPVRRFLIRHTAPVSARRP